MCAVFGVRFSSNSQCAVTVAVCNYDPVEGKLGLDNGPFYGGEVGTQL